ncbi:hypothetical protein H8D83_01435 [Candidatus Woesearchaeota archaeon]|nr:hypothetical protein [Candidatus Woesearchaeota archaeon]MBL7050818.1 hypothetical protein [Candidatus Woesearchaeota archaeon]
MNKKAITTKTIITLALVLIVVVTFLFLFSGKANIFSEGTMSCESKEGVCMNATECEGPTSNFNCDNSKHICCIKLT